jgi:predicted RNase H-like nuclease (RuvC/YqgF family)
MDEQLAQTIERLAAATESLQNVLARLDGQQEVLTTKIDRIAATLEESGAASATPDIHSQRLAELERENTELKAQAERLGRKTLSPVASTLLSKIGGDTQSFEASTLDKVLFPLSLEQRIAVKAEMARAGLIG